jgi:FkbM family methyltransferase
LLGHRDPFFDLAAIANGTPSDLLLDIGCHEGQTILRVRDAGASCPIFGFDPVPINLDAAKHHLRNETEVTLVQTAMSDRNGSEIFFVNRDSQTSSLLDNDLGNFESLHDQTEHLEPIPVETVTLDTWLDRYAPTAARIIVKCDVQGAESRVIQGGARAFRDRVVAFYGEVMLAPMYRGQGTFSELRESLEGTFGMTLFNLYPCLRDGHGRVIQTDALWVRPDCIKHLQH